MGCASSMIERISKSYTYYYDAHELNFDIDGTVNCVGEERLSAEENWKECMESMAACEMRTRYLLFPILDSRIQFKQTTLKFSTKNVDFVSLQEEFPNWAVDDISDLVDLFQSFDKDQDGLISPRLLARWLNNLGDNTDYVTRTALLLSIKDDTNYIHLRKFLKLVAYFDSELGKDHSIVMALRHGSTLIRDVRALNVVQQLSLGFA